MASVTFLPSGLSSEVEPGTTVMEAASQIGVKIQTTCGGKASCQLCKVRIVAGSDQISPMEPLELAALGNVFFITQERLSCQTRVLGNITVDVPAADSVPKKKPYRPLRSGR